LGNPGKRRFFTDSISKLYGQRLIFFNSYEIQMISYHSLTAPPFYIRFVGNDLPRHHVIGLYTKILIFLLILFFIFYFWGLHPVAIRNYDFIIVAVNRNTVFIFSFLSLTTCFGPYGPSSGECFRFL
jgi:hypothetical protein